MRRTFGKLERENGEFKFKPDLKTKIMRLTVKILFIVSIAGPLWTLYSDFMFSTYCEEPLEQAANANSVELALKELDIAIAYAEKHGLTNGFTSIFWKSESDNVGYWYRNLLACRENLESCKNAPQGVKDLQLQKLHQSLIKYDEHGTKVTVPEGISRYPYNRLLALLNTIFIVGICLIGKP